MASNWQFKGTYGQFLECKPSEDAKGGAIYAIRFANGLVKIGESGLPSCRIAVRTEKGKRMPRYWTLISDNTLFDPEDGSRIIRDDDKGYAVFRYLKPDGSQRPPFEVDINEHFEALWLRLCLADERRAAEFHGSAPAQIWLLHFEATGNPMTSGEGVRLACLTPEDADRATDSFRRFGMPAVAKPYPAAEAKPVVEHDEDYRPVNPRFNPVTPTVRVKDHDDRWWMVGHEVDGDDCGDVAADRNGVEVER